MAKEAMTGFITEFRYLPPDDAGPAAVGERTGTLAVSLLPRECRVLAISLALAAQ